MKLFDKRIPTLLAVIFLVVGVAVTSLLVQQGVIVFQNAAPSDVPQNIRITNMSDTSFTVTYTTDARVVGTISLMKDGANPQVILDDRDEQSGVPKPYMLHSISAKDLSANTSYTFKILSATTTYLNGDIPFSLTTPAAISDTPSSQVPLAGKILLPDGTNPDESLIFVTTDNGQVLSTLLNPSGLYILPLNTLRTKDFTSFLTLSDHTKLQILAQNATLTSHVVVGTNGINPLPPITLSQDYDFTVSTNALATGSAHTNFPLFSSDTSLTATPEIITPKKDQSFSDQQPQFSGTALPNSPVTITIHSDAVVNTQVTTNNNGTWQYRPTIPLSPGQHTITITAPDATGILHTIQQSFTVYAAGSTVDQSATPSATLAPTKAPTATPTPTPTKVVTQPTATPSTNSVSPTPTFATSTAKPTPRATLPPTGSNTVAIAGIAGALTTIVGIVLFFVTSGAVL